MGEVYNIGGGRQGAVSMNEAIDLCELITGRDLLRSYEPIARIGDHQWWISDNRPFMENYEWRTLYDVEMVLREIYAANVDWLVKP
jgi:CDP-paratose 2-epimerase